MQERNVNTNVINTMDQTTRRLRMASRLDRGKVQDGPYDDMFSISSSAHCRVWIMPLSADALLAISRDAAAQAPDARGCLTLQQIKTCISRGFS